MFNSVKMGVKQKLYCNGNFKCNKRLRNLDGVKNNVSKAKGECPLFAILCANPGEKGRSIAVGRSVSQEVDTALFFPPGSSSRRRVQKHDKPPACRSYSDRRLHGGSISSILRL
jgi:hypothetical protein